MPLDINKLYEDMDESYLDALIRAAKKSPSVAPQKGLVKEWVASSSATSGITAYVGNERRKSKRVKLRSKS